MSTVARSHVGIIDPGARVGWLDTARGIGILLVTFGHVLHGLILGGIATGTAWQWGFVTLYTFHMPLFMVLAGVNMPAAYACGTVPFLRRKLMTVGYPYILWSLIQGLCLILLSAHTNHLMTGERLLRIGWDPIAQFWFLYALLLYAIAIAVAGMRRGVLIGLAGVAVLLEPLAIRGSGIGLVLHHAAYFAAGIIGSRIILTARAVPAWYAVIGWIGLFAVGRAMIPPHALYGYLGLAAYPCAIAGIWLVLAMARGMGGPLAHLLAVLGRASLPIYVLHLFAASGLRIAVVRLGIELPALAHLLLGTAVGVGVPLAVAALLDRYGLLPVVGLGRARERRPAIWEQAPPSFGGPAWTARRADSPHG